MSRVLKAAGFALALLVVLNGVMISQAADGGRTPTAAGGVTIPYGTQLNNQNGSPVADGAYDFVFALYDAQAGGPTLWHEMQTGVVVKGGAVRTGLGASTPLPAGLAAAKILWLEVGVRGPGERDFTMLAPRQALIPGVEASPDTLTCPHSHFEDAWSGTSTAYGLVVDNSTGTGDGIRSYSGSTASNFGAIYAINTASGSPGAGGNAVYASSYSGYPGYFYGGGYRGLYASSDSAWYTAVLENRGGSSYAGVYIDGTLWVTGVKTGYVADLATNAGSEPLETGDVVVITGYAPAVSGETPVIAVRRATEAGSAGVAGVVDQPIGFEKPANGDKPLPAPSAPRASLADGTAVAPGGYVMVVTLGAFRLVKADATKVPIHPGDLLVSSSMPGYAMASSDPRMGTVVGKALGELLQGTGLIPVLVTLK